MQPRTNITKPKLKSIAITERDSALLRIIADFGVLSTEQVYRLCFPSIHRARKRLQRLFEHRFVKRHVQPVRMGEGSSAFFYRISSKGRRLLPQVSMDSGRVLRNNLVSTSNHSHRINDFRIALSLACRQFGTPSLRTWRQGKDLRFRANIQLGTERKEIPIVPDAFFTLRHGAQDFSYFLELDNGTTDLKRIRQKLLAYFDLWQMRLAASTLGIRSFRILYVTTTEKRLLNMLKTLAELGAKNHRLDLISMTCFEQYNLESPEKLFQSIWNTMDATGSPQTVCPFPDITSKLPTASGKPPV